MTRLHSLPAEWLPVSLAPSDADLEVCVMDYDGIIHALAFPCHKDNAGWVNASTKKHIDIQPTHWRNWSENPSYSTRYRKAKESNGLTGSFGDRSWARKAII